LAVAPGKPAKVELTFTAERVDPDPYPMHVVVTGPAMPLNVPLTLVGADEVGRDDLALASKGAKVTCDSEYAQEKPCVGKVIDGIIATPDDFQNRWHSDLATPHPHWIEVKLPKAARIGRVVIRFADPLGYPTSFQGLLTPAGETQPKVAFDVTDNQDTRLYRATLAQPVLSDTFRLVLRGSASKAYANAAQISEIELYPAP
jgi:hypothetical protein